MKKRIASTFCILALLLSLSACSRAGDGKIRIRVLLLPKFEAGELSGDFPGEAQLYYETYLKMTV